jgi:hypothetical protein
MGGGNLSQNTTGNANNVGTGGAAPIASPLANTTTPELGLPGFPSASASSQSGQNARKGAKPASSAAPKSSSAPKKGAQPKKSGNPFLA